jgi:hypothetical protein
VPVPPVAVQAPDRIVCLAPPARGALGAGGETVAVEVTVNNASWSASGLRFRYDAPATLLAAAPAGLEIRARGSSTGGLGGWVRIRGAGFTRPADPNAEGGGVGALETRDRFGIVSADAAARSAGGVVCRFGALRAPGVWLSSSALACAAPPDAAEPGTVALDVSLNGGADFTFSGLSFTF